ncbi:hypothetical protein BD289DRAFT_378187 [Coniella lustricola]|uniref:General negative regulator of transcription subunit 4 n=1 Tax=Coniella lustricola TaxID=2025994 RepID=A0A2T2ZUH6_9PEZI|nr:hypothetical protein BD289DRAFT_378187 [Coniella lustricola]
MAPQDTFVDDEEESCPLCIEEFDLSDKNFRPCPCGYQVCQFCFHNIKSNMNGLCPACRRPYDEKTIQYKAVTAEEQAEFRANLQKSRKKRAELQGQREVQKRESEKDARKNLVGIRVVQKNLVYVTGLTPTVKEDELLKTLRRPEFFGQYGNIQKISISNRKNQEGQNQSLGIYVTFEKKDDAQRCIQAVNGSQNGDRVLKAQLGTTKYCSAWLRHEQCTNRQCMFLHELGEEEDSYTRQDLSSLNSMQTQRGGSGSGGGGGNGSSSSRSVSRQQVQQQPPPQLAQSQSYHAAPPMARTSSKDGSDTGEGPALPATANWARTTQQRSRRGSHATSGAASSPAVSMSLPATTETTEDAVDVTSQDDTPDSADATPDEATTADAPVFEALKPAVHPADYALKEILKILGAGEYKLRPISPDNTVPPLFDPRGGEKRRAMREEEERRLNGEQDEQTEPLEASEGEPESGSLALGGEPEDRDHGRESHAFEQRRAIAQPPISRSSVDGLYGPGIASGFTQGAPGVAALGNRTMTPQQQAYLRPQASFAENLPPGINPSQPSLFQGQGQGQGQSHNRQTSRFNFGTDAQATANNNTLKMAANPRLMAQQQQASNPAFHSQPGGPYYSSMPGPPPGLKSTGTPPNMFSQGGAFGNTGFGAKDNNEVLQNLIRGRTAGVGQTHDASKREYMFPTFPYQYPPSTSSTPAPATAGLMAALYSNGAHQDIGAKQKKKGKKQRHANTSSTGGGGLVDLADPSILQARIQHHQQSNAGVGSAGLFGGQASGGYNPNVLYNNTPPYRGW